jgi:hypothetical protein
MAWLYAGLMNRSPRRSRTDHLWILAAALTALVGSFVLQPSGTGNLCLHAPVLNVKVILPDTCFSRRVLGVSCPGCGLTRSFVAMARGDFAGSFSYNPMGPVLFIICLAQVPYRIIQYAGLWRERATWLRTERLLAAVIWIVAVGLIMCWLAKIVYLGRILW